MTEPTFVPTDEWQDLPEGAVCPPGLEYDLGLGPDGGRRARRMQPKAAPAENPTTAPAEAPKSAQRAATGNPLDLVLSRLHGAKRLADGKWLALCPAHDDHEPSLSVSTAQSGTVLLHCHAGCETEDVLKAIGLTFLDLNADSQGRSAASSRRAELGPIVATYDYHSADGTLLFQVTRHEPKDFRQRRPDGRGGWVWGLGGVQPVLYRLPALLKADPTLPVWIVEGEKDADRLARPEIGFVTTTNAGGAGKWRAAYSEHLRGRQVFILPDNDEPGREHARQVARSLQGIASEVRVLELPGLPEKGDVSDWLGGGGTFPNLLTAAIEAPLAEEWLQAHADLPASDGLEVPALPESARLPASLGSDASPWLDRYIAFSQTWSPRAFDGFHEAVGLWVLSTVAARRVVLHLGTPRYTPLYVAQAARTSLFAKSTTADIGVQVLQVAGLEWLLAADAATPQKFLRDLTLRVPDDFDRLPEEWRERVRTRLALAGQRGWYYEEFGQQLHAMSRQDGIMADFRGILRRFDDCKGRYETGTIGRGDEVIERPYLALLANLTPADLRPMATRGSAPWADGFLARFALVSPGNEERSRGRFPQGVRLIPEDLSKPLRAWHERLGVPAVSITDELSPEGKPTGRKKIDVQPIVPRVCMLGNGVFEAYYTYHDGLLDLIEAGDNSDLDGNYSRFAEKALRIAILLASLENNDRLEMRHWARGQAIAERWRAGLHAIYEQINEPTESDSELAEVRVLSTIRRLKKPTIREIAQRIWGMSAAEVKRHLEALLETGEVCEIDAGRTKRYVLAGTKV